MRTARRFAGVRPSRGHCSPLTGLPTVRSLQAMGRFAPARPAQPERKHRRRRDAESGPLSRAARRRRVAWKDIAVHEGWSFYHAIAVGRFGMLPEGEALPAGTLYNGCAGACSAGDYLFPNLYSSPLDLGVSLSFDSVRFVLSFISW